MGVASDPSPDLPREIARIVQGLEAEPGVDGAWLFGSAAKGKLRPGSDFDLALRYTPDQAGQTRRQSWLSLMGELAEVAGRDVQLVDLEGAPNHLRFHVFRDGVCLFDRRPDATRRLKVATILARFDWEPMRRQITAILDRRFGVPRDRVTRG